MSATGSCPPIDWRGQIYAVGYLLRDSIRLGRRERMRASRAHFGRLIAEMKTSPLAIDCGANVGKITEELLNAGYTVHAFEPEPLVLAAFQSRFNGRPNLILHQQAVGIAQSTAILYRHKDVSTNKKRTEASSLIKQPKCDDRQTVEVQVADLPAFIAAQPSRIGILKMDIEGIEVVILNAILDRGQHHDIDFILAETHERFGLLQAWRTAQLRGRVRQNGITNIDLDHP